MSPMFGNGLSGFYLVFADLAKQVIYVVWLTMCPGNLVVCCGWALMSYRLSLDKEPPTS